MRLQPVVTTPTQDLREQPPLARVRLYRDDVRDWQIEVVVGGNRTVKDTKSKYPPSERRVRRQVKKCLRGAAPVVTEYLVF